MKEINRVSKSGEKKSHHPDNTWGIIIVFLNLTGYITPKKNLTLAREC